MNVYTLYNKLCEYFPATLSAQWDNDGLMCTCDGEKEVKKVLLALDVTSAVMEQAVKTGCDLIISHHPLVFRPLRSVTPQNYVSDKVISAISNGISVFSFHTRADCAERGVNTMLAKALGLRDVSAYGEGGMGRIGTLERKMPLVEFAKLVKRALGCDVVSYAGENEAFRVAVLGGDGKDFIPDALAEGADTFVSGSISYNAFLDAPEMGINAVEAGHFHTENVLLDSYEQILHELCPDVTVCKCSSLCIKTL